MAAAAACCPAPLTAATLRRITQDLQSDYPACRLSVITPREVDGYFFSQVKFSSAGVPDFPALADLIYSRFTAQLNEAGGGFVSQLFPLRQKAPSRTFALFRERLGYGSCDVWASL